MISFKSFIEESDDMLFEAYSKDMMDIFTPEELQNAGRTMSYWGIGVQGSTFKEIDAKAAMRNAKTLDGKVAFIKTKENSQHDGDSFIVIFKYDTINARNITRRFTSKNDTPNRKKIVDAAERIFITDIPDNVNDLQYSRMKSKPSKEKPLQDRLAAFKAHNKTGFAFSDSKNAEDDFEKIKEKVKVEVNKILDDFHPNGGVAKYKERLNKIFYILGDLAIYSVSLDKEPSAFNMEIYKKSVENLKKMNVI